MSLISNTASLKYGDKLSHYGSLDSGSWGINYSGTITGTLADGTALDNPFTVYNIGDFAGTADIIVVPEPATLLLLSLGGLFLRKRKA